MTSEQQAVPVAQGLDETTPGFLIDLASRIHAKATPAMGFDGYDVDRLIEIARSLAEPASHPCKSGEDAGEIDGLTRRVAEVVNEDGGCWTACSGCQESDEGHVSEKYYPYSPIFQCQPGGGCSECGGIGVIWQDGDFLASYGDALSEDATQTREAELVAALKMAVDHIEHMAAWITRLNSVYSFESLGEDMPNIKAALPAGRAK